MRYIFNHVVESGHFVSRSVGRRLQFCELLIMISMPPSKVCPQCETIVPLRLKVCYKSQPYRAFAVFVLFRILSVTCSASQIIAHVQKLFSASMPKY